MKLIPTQYLKILNQEMYGPYNIEVNSIHKYICALI